MKISFVAGFGPIVRDVDHIAVKEPVFPFARFPGTDPVLGPEMKSTGEVMGIDEDLGIAFAKSQMAAGGALPTPRQTSRRSLPRIA